MTKLENIVVPAPIIEPASIKLSVSKTKTFANCKKQFRFTYVEKLPRKTHSFHSVGKFCHKVLEDFHRAYINGSTEHFKTEMTKAFKAAQIEYKAEMTPEMIQECLVMIKGYLAIMLRDQKNNCLPNVLEVERNFTFPLSENVIITGMIDRIQIDADNALHIADYKTTKNKKYLMDDWFQLLTYAYVMLVDNPDLKKIRGSYILLRHDFEYITTEFDVAQILSIKDQYIEYANKMIMEKEYPANPTALCSWCDHLDICAEGLEKTGKYSNSAHGETDW